MTGTRCLTMWTVYDHPKDYPRSVIARMWEVGPQGEVPTGRIMTGRTLDDIRTRLIDLGLARIERSPGDDPCIVETWL